MRQKGAEALLARHRTLTIAALVLMTLLAWGWLAMGAGTGMDLSMALFPPGADGPSMLMASDPAMLFWMWWVMMAAMMLPSAAPTILLYARAARHGGPQDTVPPTGWFLSGYLIVWGAFSLLAALAQWALESAGLFDRMAMHSTSTFLSAALLAAAGIYQLTPLKGACLLRCRNPAEFIARHHRPGKAGALRLGLLHGSYCVGCCWILMALLFVGGVMNLLWILLLTLLVASEKLLPAGPLVGRLGGAALLVASVLLVI